ncbi:MAG: flagellar export chaperone FliS [Bacteriovoracia bacterium]
MTYGANQYKRTAVKTATPGQILIMLYEAAIRHLRRAVACIEANDLNGKGVAIGKSHDILNELNNSLNFEVGGEVAKQLEGLYNYCIGQLLKANVENQKEPLISVIKVMENLLEGWRGAVEQVNKGVSK